MFSRFLLLTVVLVVVATGGCKSVVELPANKKPTSMLLDVPYYFQYDNKEEGWRACNITSIAMVLDFYNVKPKQSEFKRTPDYLHSRFGIQQEPSALAEVFNTIARENGLSVRDELFTSGTINQLQDHLKSGQPAIVHGWFTESGHIMVVTGFDGEFYTVNDPAGQWNLKKFEAGQYDNSVSGHGIKYPADAFEYAINDNGTGDDLWLHLFSSSENKLTSQKIQPPNKFQR